MNRLALFSLLSLMTAADATAANVPAPSAVPIPAGFEAKGPELTAIKALLDTYTRAVSSKNQALFETLLLDLSVPFAYVPAIGVAPGAEVHGYPGFRHAVFEGPPFTQQFRDVRITQDGALASVTLVFVNTRANGSSSWGWKGMHLIKVEGHWKIASEFFTSHPLDKKAAPATHP